MRGLLFIADIHLYREHLYRFISFAWRVIFSDGSPALFQPEFVGIPGDRSVQTVH